MRTLFILILLIAGSLAAAWLGGETWLAREAARRIRSSSTPRPIRATANSSTVGWARSRGAGISSPRPSDNAWTILTEETESPPSPKKSSSARSCGYPSTSHHTWATIEGTDPGVPPSSRDGPATASATQSSAASTGWDVVCRRCTVSSQYRAWSKRWTGRETRRAEPSEEKGRGAPSRNARTGARRAPKRVSASPSSGSPFRTTKAVLRSASAPSAASRARRPASSPARSSQKITARSSRCSRPTCMVKHTSSRRSPGESSSARASRPAVSRSRSGVRPDRGQQNGPSSTSRGGRTGASSRTTWALVPARLKQLTPARRGASPRRQEVSWSTM